MAKILIVEDELIVSMAYSHYLTRLGHHIVGEAAQGKIAIELVKSKSPDVILLDVELEDDMSGFDVAKAIRQFNASAKIIFTSGKSEKSMEYKVEVFEKTYSLSKPINLKSLVDIINN